MIKKASFMLLGLLCLCCNIKAQNNSASLESPLTYEAYEIGKIAISGAEYSDASAIIAMSGLKIGQKIRVPGEQLNHAMKLLWQQRLFMDIEILQTKTIGDVIFLEIKVQEFPRIKDFKLSGIKKSEREKVTPLLHTHLMKGTILSEQTKRNVKAALKDYFDAKGYSNAIIQLKEKAVPGKENFIQLHIDVDKRDKVKVLQINFTGNTVVSNRKLRKLMEFTHEKRKLFKKSVLTSEGFSEDKKRILSHYNQKGYRDAAITAESLTQSEEGDWIIDLHLEEGALYSFGQITWRGNSVYSTDQLNEILGIKSGEVYNAALLEERLHFGQDGRDISSFYMDYGHLFFQVEAVETSITGSVIDLEIRMQEGPIAKIGKVIISGNDVTSEEVIRREIRTKPGDFFSRAALIRSQRELINMGYFNPENLQVKTDIHPEQGTVDIEYVVEEHSNDQFELAMGWDPASKKLQGTVGIQFNNFSVSEIFKKDAWDPFPRGKGQSLGFRLQSTGKSYQSYNLSFTEPWLGGKKPTNLSVSAFYTNRFYEDSEGVNQQFNVLGGMVNVSTRLRFPDDNFVSSTSLNVQRIRLNDWQVDGFVLDDGNFLSNGNFYNLYLKQTIARSTLNHPIFPTGGSKVSLAMQFTPPYSLFRKQSADATPEEAFKWLEYYKARLDAEWYNTIGRSKFVVKAAAKMGILGAYNADANIAPFERFWLGGDGLSGQQGFTGVDLISLRGYDDQRDFEANLTGGARAFSKFTVELRYPFLQSPAASVYGITFAEMGNAWSKFDDISPFDLKRSVGAGLRIHLPMFGTLGFDYGLGFDKTSLGGSSLLSKYGQFNIILGFEPD